MRRRFTILCIALFLCILAQADCSARPWVPDKPEDTALELWITEDVRNRDLSGFGEEEGWYGARVYYGTGYHAFYTELYGRQRPEHCVTYYVTAYPDYADGGQFVTRIEITDPEACVYGLTLNSDPEAFNAVFQKMGLALSTADDCGQVQHQARRDNITFILEPGRRLVIDAAVSNRENICF